MDIPDWFAARVHDESGGRLRVRWSPQRQIVLIEQKIARGKPLPLPRIDGLPREKRKLLQETWDRARDGYDLFMTVHPGDRTRCPWCERDTPIPVMQMREAKCRWCQKTFRAAYWPLSDALLERLRYADPDRGGIERAFAEIAHAEVDRERRARRARHTATRDLWGEHFNEVFEIPSVGYTGRERMWA